MPAFDHEPGGARPRVLFLSCHLPWPAVSGGRRRELELIRRVAKHFDVVLIVVSKTPRQDRANAPALRRYCCRVEVFSAAPVDGEMIDRGYPSALLRHRSQAMTRRVGEILAHGEIDLIHVEGFYLMQHVPEWAWQPLLLVEQNVEYELERQRSARTGDSVARRRFMRAAAAERDSWEKATQLAAVTSEDAATIETAAGLRTVRVVPDGADHIPSGRRSSEHSDVEHPDAPLIVLLANFGYAPNVDAALHLHGDILPRIRERIPTAHVWLVGNIPPPEVQALASASVTVTGHVPDVLPYLDTADVVVCPLRIGGGIKVKTIEALRRGKAIVSTSVGAQGLTDEARDALAIADDPAAFADRVSTLLLDKPARARLERRAARAASTLPTWNQAADALRSAYDELLWAASGRRDPIESAEVATGVLR